MSVMIRFVDESIDSMLQHPEFWGGHRSIESQVMRLLEVRALAVNPRGRPEDARSLETRYVEFMRRELPNSPETTLFTRVSEDRGRFKRLLSAFVASTREHQVSLSRATFHVVPTEADPGTQPEVQAASASDPSRFPREEVG